MLKLMTGGAKQRILLCILLTSSVCPTVIADALSGETGIRDGYFFAEEIGWRMPVPEGWEVMGAEKIEALQDRGQEALSETLGAEIDPQGLKQLLNLQKAEPNNFQSTIEPFAENYEGEWHDNNAALRELLIDTYTNAGLGVEVSDTVQEVIGGVTFEYMEFRLLAPDGSELLRQAMYSSLINGFDFGASASYNDAELGAELLRAWKASTFTGVQE